jgi:hypothetical protein
MLRHMNIKLSLHTKVQFMMLLGIILVHIL